jgi:hypothetical protein
VHFAPTYLSREEFSVEAQEWMFSTGDDTRIETLPPDSLAFCLCGVPVIYRIANQAKIRLQTNERKKIVSEGKRLDRSWSQCLFARDGKIRKIEVDVTQTALRKSNR